MYSGSYIARGTTDIMHVLAGAANIVGKAIIDFAVRPTLQVMKAT